MRDISEIAANLARVKDPETEWQNLEALAAEIEEHPDGQQLIEAVLALFERFPESDFGAPGSLTHAIETFFGPVYIDALLDSLARKPTEQTLNLASRVLNAPRKEQRVLMAITEVIHRGDIPSHVSEQAKEILSRQSKRL